MRAQFVVENAGCASCGALVSEVLAVMGAIESLEIDEAADVATVRLSARRMLAVEDIERILEVASDGSGHDYRVRLGSWTVDDRDRVA